MLIAAGQETPLIVLFLASPLVAVLLFLPFLLQHSEDLAAALLYGALGFFAATVFAFVAPTANAPWFEPWFEKNGGVCTALAMIGGPALGAAFGVWSRRLSKRRRR